MRLTREFDRLVTELHQAHPRFPRITIARLVVRTAQTYVRDRSGELCEDAVPVVRQAAGEQLRYLDNQSGPPVALSFPVGRQRRPVED